MSTHLFIGGSADGKRISVREGLPYCVVPVQQRMPLLSHAHSVHPRDATFRTESYERMQWRSGTSRVDVFVISGMSPEDTLAALLNGYRTPNENSEEHF